MRLLRLNFSLTFNYNDVVTISDNDSLVDFCALYDIDWTPPVSVPNIFDVKSIKVTGAGIQALNGIYEREGLNDDFPRFVLRDQSDDHLVFEMQHFEEEGRWIINEMKRQTICALTNRMELVKG